MYAIRRLFLNATMRLMRRFILLILFFINYVTVGSFACLCHNHARDFRFHENCPACQWQVQFQDDFSEASAILDALDNPLQFIEYKPYDQSSIQLKECVGFTYLSRAPPTPLS